jgi:hypothetical protein
MENLVRRDDVWGKKAKELYKIRQLRLQYEKTEKELLKQFKVFNGDQESYSCGFKFMKQVRPGVVKYKEIPVLQGLDLNMYRGNDIEIWKLEYTGDLN